MFLTSTTNFSEGDGGEPGDVDEEERPPGGEKAGSPGEASPATPRGGSKKSAVPTERLVAQRHRHPFWMGIRNPINKMGASRLGQSNFFDAHIRGDV